MADDPTQTFIISTVMDVQTTIAVWSSYGTVQASFPIEDPNEIENISDVQTSKESMSHIEWGSIAEIYDPDQEVSCEVIRPTTGLLYPRGDR